jgi:hypothetical protein
MLPGGWKWELDPVKSGWGTKGVSVSVTPLRFRWTHAVLISVFFSLNLSIVVVVILSCPWYMGCNLLSLMRTVNYNI